MRHMPATHTSSAAVRRGNRPSECARERLRELDDLADAEVDLQNAVHCIRLRGDDDIIAIEPPLRKAA